MKRAFLALTVALLLLLVAGVGTAAANPPATRPASGPEGQDAEGPLQEQRSRNRTARWSRRSRTTRRRARRPVTRTRPSRTPSRDRALALLLPASGRTARPAPAVPDARAAQLRIPGIKLDGKTCFEPYPMPSPREECPGSCAPAGDGTQVIGQSADNEQDAAALAATDQEKPSNENVPSASSARATAVTSRSRTRRRRTPTAGQPERQADGRADQAGARLQAGGSGDQVIGQSADNDQDAAALAETVQEGRRTPTSRSGSSAPVTTATVSQSNEASSNATAGNINLTGQTADQTQAGRLLQVRERRRAGHRPVG